MSVNQSISNSGNQSIDHKSISFLRNKSQSVIQAINHFYIYSILKGIYLPLWTAALNLVACVGRVSVRLGGLGSIE